MDGSDPHVLLTAYNAQGRQIARIEVDASNQAVLYGVQPPANGKVRLAWARLVVQAPATPAPSVAAGTLDPNRLVVLDVIPSRNELPIERANDLRIEVVTPPATPPVVKSVEYGGHVRCYLTDQLLVVRGTLKNQRLPLVWTSFFANTNFDLSQDFSSKVDTMSLGPTALFDHWGWHPAILPFQAVKYQFVPAPIPPEPLSSLDNLDDNLANPKSSKRYFVVRFTREMRMQNRDQSLRCDDLQVSIDAQTVVRAGLSSNPRAVLTTQILNCVEPQDVLGASQRQWIVRVQGVPMVPALTTYNRLATRYLDAMQTVNAGRPVTGVPLFSEQVWDEATSSTIPLAEVEFQRKWVFSFNITDEQVISAGNFPDETNNHPDIADELRLPRRIRFRAAFPVDLTATPNAFAHRLWLPGLARHDFYLHGDAPFGAPYAGVVNIDCAITGLGQLVPPPAPDYPYAWDSVECGFLMLLYRQYPDAGQTTPYQWVRIGALDLAFAAPLPDVPGRFDDRLNVLPTPTDDPLLQRGSIDRRMLLMRQRSLLALGSRRAAGDWSLTLPTVVLELQMRVDLAVPGGQDGLPNEPLQPVDVGEALTVTPTDASPSAIRRRFVREPALLIPKDEVSSIPVLFRLREQTASFESQFLAAQLFGWSASETNSPANNVPQALVVVDRQPLTVALVHAPPLIPSGAADSNLELGNWSASGFEGASWELTGASDGFRLKFPPQAIGESMEKVADADVVDDDPAQFRLSTISEFELESSYFRQNFTEAVWNLRRVLGYPGQRGAGAGVRRLDFELLYGMHCTVRTAGLRLAELSALLGAVPGPLPGRIGYVFGLSRQNNVDGLLAQERLFDRNKLAWSRQFAAYASRLGVFQPWSQSETQSLALNSGVDYVVRPPDTIMQDPVNPPAHVAGGPRPLKLAGGALWGFDFRAQYDPFVHDDVVQPADRTRRSTAGELAHPSFSALGGWGHQKAVFQSGLTTIYSDSAMGRTYFYSVERRGRIAGYWNYAKHVVIYERTVGTALQFRPQAGVKNQDHLAGRPVLRKVREFVEILQPRRRYPDLGGGAIAAGCVQGIDFKQTVIPVDGRQWGYDVTNSSGDAIGYVVPLWREGADPAIYPKPHVEVLLSAASTPGEAHSCRHLETQKLQFFSVANVASTGKELNTDEWPAVRGVDYPDAPWPTPAPLDTLALDDLEAGLPDEVAVAPGYEPFTHAIDVAKPIDVIAGRSSKGMAAMLRNVTMVRAEPLEHPDSTSNDAAKGRRDLQAARAQLQGLEARLRRRRRTSGTRFRGGFGADEIRQRRIRARRGRAEPERTTRLERRGHAVAGSQTRRGVNVSQCRAGSLQAHRGRARPSARRSGRGQGARVRFGRRCVGRIPSSTGRHRFRTQRSGRPSQRHRANARGPRRPDCEAVCHDRHDRRVAVARHPRRRSPRADGRRAPIKHGPRGVGTDCCLCGASDLRGLDGNRQELRRQPFGRGPPLGGNCPAAGRAIVPSHRRRTRQTCRRNSRPVL